MEWQHSCNKTLKEAPYGWKKLQAAVAAVAPAANLFTPPPAPEQHSLATPLRAPPVQARAGAAA